MPRELQEPWRSFLVDLDSLIDHEVHLHCCGGFVVTMRHGLPRATADIDVLSVVPHDDMRALSVAAGQGSGRAAVSSPAIRSRGARPGAYQARAQLRSRPSRRGVTREMRPYLDRPDREDLDPLRANGSRCDWALVSVMIPHERRLSAPSQRLQRSLGDAEPVSFAVPDT
jgi:hypothetical protein